MRILATQYSLNIRALEIYVAGCRANPHCEGCHNPETWDFNQGEKYDDLYLKKIKQKVNDFDILIDNIMIFGGEPIDQNIDELIKMLKDLKSLNKSVWLFTRYEIDNVPQQVKDLCDYIKTGRYIKELITDENVQYGIKLATSNQKIYKLK